MKNAKDLRNKGLLLVLMTALISGVSIFINRFGVKGIDSTVFVFMKNLIVSIFIFGLILGITQLKSLKELSKKQWGSLIVVGLVGGSIPFVLFFKGLQMSNGPIGSLIHKTMFIFVAILAVLFLKEKLSKKILIPAVLLLVGNFLMLYKGTLELSFGAGMILVATLFWSVENVISKKLLATIDAKILAFGRLFFGSIFISIYMAFTGKFALMSSVSVSQIAWILITAAFLAGYVLTWYSGLKHVKATTATSILLLGSPITTLLGYTFSGTAVSVVQFLGMVSIFAGVGLMIYLIEKQSEKVNKNHLTTSIA